MEDRLINPQNSQPVALAKKNGVLKIDWVEFGNFRTRANDDGIYYEYKYRGIWYVLEYTPTPEDDEDLIEGLESGEYYVSPLQE